MILIDTDVLIRRFRTVHLSETASARALELLSRYRLSHGLLIPDALIAASALEGGWSFLSKNQRHYRFIEGLALLAYPPRQS